MLKSISASEAKKLMEEKKSDPEFHIIDVRTSEEFQAGAIDGAKNINLYDPGFMNMIGELDKDATYLIYCRSGSRSKAALEIMEQLGFKEVYEMDGGIISF